MISTSDGPSSPPGPFRRHVLRRASSGWWLTATLLATSFFAPAAAAQTFFYNEIVKDGRIYVFAVWARYDAFVKTDGAETGPVIERPAYGPNGETVVFDSGTAINLYNFKHGLPGEYFPQPDESPASKFPSHKFSGLMFGDYYWYYDRHQDGISSTDPRAVKGQHGLWFRRLYFTYDFAYSEKLSTRFRLEANSNGKFEGGDIVPYVKDAFIKWAYKGQQTFTLGIHQTLTFDWLESFWGLRHIEKTPADLYRLDSSRDFGFTFAGFAPVQNLTYAVQFGNESGSGSETREGKILRVETRYQRSSGLTLEGFYSFGRGASGANRHTAQGVAGFQRDTIRVGAQYLWQERQSGDGMLPDQTISVWSGFVVWDVVPKKADLFLRSDFVKGDLGGMETGLPAAEDIDYLLLSSQAPFSTWIAGGEWYLHPAVRFSPNLEIVRYTHDPDPVQSPGRRQDAILRFTFYWTF
jgi:hypothetical protein